MFKKFMPIARTFLGLTTRLSPLLSTCLSRDRRRTTFVHCKAVHGRSTTVVLCYLVQYKQMTPEDAYNYVKSIRPKVLLASIQWQVTSCQAIQNYYHLKVKKGYMNPRKNILFRTLNFPKAAEFLAFDDCSIVVVTRSNLDGYNDSPNKPTVGLSHLTTIYNVRMVGEEALVRISCMWLRCHTQQKIAEEKLMRNGSCAMEANQIDNQGSLLAWRSFGTYNWNGLN